MKTINKINALLLAMTAAVSLASCGGGDGTANDSYAEHKDASVAVAKKGVCVSRYNYGNDGVNTQGGKTQNLNLTMRQSADRINDLDVGWYYTWGSSPNNTEIDGAGEFVPMVWGKNDVNASVIQDIKTNYDNGTYTHLLTFNEPDLPDQSNITVDAALSYWDSLETIGIPLSSPAVSYYSKTDGNPWLDEFMEKADEQHKRVDFIAIHLYQSFYSDTAVNDLKETLTALYDKYKIPVWLTEFAAVDIESRDAQGKQPGIKGTPSSKCTAKNARNYMTQATNMLEQLGFIERYAWFVDNFGGMYGEERETGLWEAPYTALYDGGDELSSVGNTYKDISSNIALELQTKHLTNAKKDTAYSQTVGVAGGTGNYTFKASGLPAGLTMTASGTISGTPQTRGTYPVKVTVTDSGKTGRKQTFTHTYSLTIS